MREVVTYLQDLGHSIPAQAEACGLGERTLRRWVAQRSSPSSDCARQYLAWVTGGVLDLLRHDNLTGAQASIPRGVRLYSHASGVSGAWRALLVVLNGRDLWRCAVIDSAVPSIPVLQEQLVQLAATWTAPLRELDKRAPRLRPDESGSADRDWWSAQLHLQTAQVGVYLASGLALQGALTEDAHRKTIRDLERALEAMAQAGRKLQGGDR